MEFPIRPSRRLPSRVLHLPLGKKWGLTRPSVRFMVSPSPVVYRIPLLGKILSCFLCAPHGWVGFVADFGCFNPLQDANRGASAMAPEWCRIWWPQRRLQPEPLPAPQRFVLFGWLFARTDSVDVVVGAALPQEEILRSFPTPEALQVSDANFPYLFPSNLVGMCGNVWFGYNTSSRHILLY